MKVLRDVLKTIYGSECMQCGSRRRICVEHIVSRAIGGSNDLTNLQLLCWPCNSAKGLKIVDYRPDNWQKMVKKAKFVPPNSLPIDRPRRKRAK